MKNQKVQQTISMVMQQYDAIIDQDCREFDLLKKAAEVNVDYVPLSVNMLEGLWQDKQEKLRAEKNIYEDKLQQMSELTCALSDNRLILPSDVRAECLEYLRSEIAMIVQDLILYVQMA